VEKDLFVVLTKAWQKNQLGNLCFIPMKFSKILTGKELYKCKILNMSESNTAQKECGSICISV